MRAKIADASLGLATAESGWDFQNRNLRLAGDINRNPPSSHESYRYTPFGVIGSTPQSPPVTVS